MAVQYREGSMGRPEVNALTEAERKRQQEVLRQSGASQAEINKIMLSGMQGNSDVDAIVNNLSLQQKPNNLKQDLSTGREFGKEVIGTGLGRLKQNAQVQDIRHKIGLQSIERQRQADKTPQVANQTLGAVGNIRDVSQNKEVADLERSAGLLRNIADKGLSRQEVQAEREALLQQTGQAQQTASRRAQALLASTGVQGSVAGRQLLDIETQGMQQRGNIARDLFLKSEQIKREGAQNLASMSLQRQGLSDTRNIQAQQLGVQRDTSLMQANQTRNLNQANLNLTTATTNENIFQGRQSALEAAQTNQANLNLGISQFDLGQAAKEKNILLQSGLGFAAIGASERGAQAASNATVQAAQAQGGGGKIICTELNRQGILSDDIMIKDAAYGVKLRIEKPHIYRGYIKLATPVVKLMRKSNKFTKLVSIVALPWAENMAYNNNKIGKIITVIGEFVCGVVGKIIGE